MSLLAFLLLLGPVVFIHELGHFLAAKWAKIWVHRFALGLGTPIKALTFTRGGTEYAVCWLPLGGYVKMASREEEATTSALEGATPETAAVPTGMYYEDKPVWKRMVVTLAGVTMNVILAFVLFFALDLGYGRTVISEMRVGAVDIPSLPRGAEALRMLRVGDRITAVNGVHVSDWQAVGEGLINGGGSDVSLTVNDSLTVLLLLHADQLDLRAQAYAALTPYWPAVIASVDAGTPAARAGISAQDTVVGVNGTAVTQWLDLVKLLHASPGRPVTLELANAAGHRSLTVTPDSVTDATGAVIGQVGIRPVLPTEVHQAIGLGAAIADAGGAVGTASRIIFKTLRGMLFGRISGKALGGPIAIGQQAGQALALGFEAFITFMATISVNLAVVNLFPIPILDGGQALFLLAEGAARRPLSLKTRERLMFAGLLMILALMIFVFWNDIARSWPALMAWWRKLVH